MMTKQEVAKFLKVSMSTVSRWIAEGRIEAHKFAENNGNVRISREALERFVDSNKKN